MQLFSAYKKNCCKSETRCIQLSILSFMDSVGFTSLTMNVFLLLISEIQTFPHVEIKL